MTKGTRVKMDPEHRWLGVPPPDLGLGTITAVDQAECPGLMEGLYVFVEWDEPQPASLSYVAKQALLEVSS